MDTLYLGVVGKDVLQFNLIVLVEGNVAVADEVVALLACAFGRGTIEPLLPSKHRLADVDATVVDDVGLHYLVAAGSDNL